MGQADDVGVREEIVQKGFDVLEGLGAAQVEEEHAGAGGCGGGLGRFAKVVAVCGGDVARLLVREGASRGERRAGRCASPTCARGAPGGG